MVWPAILMEWSVEEDSSFGGGGVGSAGFSFSTVFVSFSWVRSCADAASGVSASSRVVVRAVRFVIISTPQIEVNTLRYKRSGLTSRRVYSKFEVRGWELGWR